MECYGDLTFLLDIQCTLTFLHRIKRVYFHVAAPAATLLRHFNLHFYFTFLPGLLNQKVTNTIPTEFKKITQSKTSFHINGILFKIKKRKIIIDHKFINN